MDAFTGRTAKFCPDVQQTPSNIVNLGDVLWALAQVGPGHDVRGDVDGNGVSTLGDVLGVLAEVGTYRTP